MVDAYPELWSRLKRKWNDNEDIIDRMKVIEVKFEAKLVVGMLCGRYKGSSAQFVLKNCHNFSSYKKEPEAPAPAPEPPKEAAPPTAEPKKETSPTTTDTPRKETKPTPPEPPKVEQPYIRVSDDWIIEL
jgi:hypothetical protein